jgi:putative acetyltransferase
MNTIDSITIRPETPNDIPAIRAVHDAAFGRNVESHLVDLLRERGRSSLSLVAELDGRIVGHVLFSPVTVDDEDQADATGVGLAPIGVLPELQNRDIGGRLTRDALERCRADGWRYAVVLGHPPYYPRFGFRTASGFGLKNEYDVDEPFMAMELVPGGLPPNGGMIRYAPEFAEVLAEAEGQKN